MKKNIIMIGTIGIIFTVAVIIWWQRKLILSPKYTGPTEKIVIANIGEYSILNLVAQDRGYFKENGLDAEIKEYPSGPPAIADLLAGKADVASLGEFVVVSKIFTNTNIRILAQVSKQKVIQLVARKDRGINNISNLKGKKIGATLKSNGEFYLGRFLAFNNLLFQDVIIIDMSPIEMSEQINSGQIDAAATFEPNVFNIKNKLGDNAIVWPVQGDQDAFALLISTYEFLISHPQSVARYMQSLMQAEQYIKNHNAEAKEILAKAMRYDSSYIDYIWPKINFGLALEQSMLLTLEDEARWFIKNRLTESEKVYNYLNFIYFDALSKVKPEAVTIIH